MSEKEKKRKKNPWQCSSLPLSQLDYPEISWLELRSRADFLSCKMPVLYCISLRSPLVLP